MSGWHENHSLLLISDMREWSDTDLAWLAGFIDGEGCIRISRYKPTNRDTSTYAMQVQISQKDPTVLLQVRDTWGGSVSVHHRDKNAGSCNYQVKAKKAQQLLEDVLPYLVIKREQAEIALRFQQRRLSKSIGRKRIDRSEDEIDYWALRDAKRR